MSEADVERRYNKQRRHEYHSANLQAGNGSRQGETAEILRALSQIDDLPIEPRDDPIMGQLISRLTSTANLTPEQVKSNEWVREYILILYLSKYPTHEGMHGSWRGWSHADAEQEVEALDAQKRMELETLVTSSKLALSRSEDAKVIEESSRNVNESIVNDEGDGGGGRGGLMGMIRG